MPLIQIDKLRYSAQRKTILEDVSFSIYQGQFVTLIGPNGAGKTTLLKLIIGLLSPNQGKVLQHINLDIGYVPQKIKVNQLMPLKVQAFLELCIPKKNQLRIYNELGITKLLTESIHLLSGGELQRVLMAQALGKFSHDIKENQLNTELLILDEPSQGMDAYHQGELFKLLTTYNKYHGLTILMVSHDLHFVHQASTHVICLNRHICCQGKPQEVSLKPAYHELFPNFDSTILPYAHYHNHLHDRTKPISHDCAEHP